MRTVMAAAVAAMAAGGASAATVDPGFTGPGYVYEVDAGQTPYLAFAVELTDPTDDFGDLFTDPALVTALFQTTLDFGTGSPDYQVMTTPTSIKVGGGVTDTFNNYATTASGEECVYDGETRSYVDLNADGVLTYSAFNTDALTFGPADCAATTYPQPLLFSTFTVTGTFTAVNGAPAVPSSVPLPASAPLMLVALAGFGVLRRLRRS